MEFRITDITKPWDFSNKYFDLVSFSLVLEHHENLDHIFEETARVLKPGAYVYLGELHPYKQNGGSKARFQTSKGEKILSCFIHHTSEYLHTAKKYGLEIRERYEYFDKNGNTDTSRILCLLLQKKSPWFC